MHQDYSPCSLSHNSVYALCEDSHHNIWVGTYYGGVSLFTPYHPNKQFYTASLEHPDRLSFPFVGKMTEDDSGNLWICTEGGGLNKFDPASGKFTRYTHQENNPQTVGNNNLKTIYYHQPSQRLYIGTHTGGLSIFDLRKNSFHVLNSSTPGPHKLADNIVNEIQKYKDGLAILTQGGLFFMDLQTETFSLLSDDPQIKELLEKQFTYETFFIDSRNRLWLAPSIGGLVCIHLSSNKVEQYKMDVENPSSIGKFRIVNIFEDSHGELYFGTIVSGLFKYQAQEHAFKVTIPETVPCPTITATTFRSRPSATSYCYFTTRDCLFSTHRRRPWNRPITCSSKVTVRGLRCTSPMTAPST
ncbi:MAG: hypothetical protein LUE99_11345 [Bacteroides sp.]|nr:hypothetical protein [Bacteroides sp.]